MGKKERKRRGADIQREREISKTRCKLMSVFSMPLKEAIITKTTITMHAFQL